MSFIGFTFFGPHGLVYYWYLNPYIISSAKRMIPKFFLNYYKTKKVILSVIFDTVFYPIPFIPVMLMYIGTI